MTKPLQILLVSCLLSLTWSLTADTIHAAVTPQDRFFVVLADYADIPENPGAVVVLSVDGQGRLQQEGSCSTGGYIRLFDSPSYPSVDTIHGRLFVANNFSNDIAVFTMQSDGSIDAVDGSPFPAGDGSTFTALHPSGNFLYVAQWRESTIGVYEVSELGQLTPLQTVMTFRPGLLEVAPDGDFLYAADMAIGLRGYSVSHDGTLTELPGSPITYPNMNRPAYLELSSNGSMLFLLDLDEGIASFTVDGSGMPSVVPGSPFAIGHYATKLTLTHDDCFIYTLSDAHIYGFEVLPDGSLLQLPDSPYPFEAGYAWTLINPPDEDWLYAGNMAGKSVLTYSISPDGILVESAPPVGVDDALDRWPNGAVYYRPAGGSVDIDIRPGSYINPINPRSQGVIPVALLGSMDYDVLNVDVTTLRFGPSEAAAAHNLTDAWTYNDHLQDVNLDGFLDLMVHFPTQGSGIACGDSEASLTGGFSNGQQFSGADSIRTVGCGRRRDSEFKTLVDRTTRLSKRHGAGSAAFSNKE